MKDMIVKVSVIFLLLISGKVYAQMEDGRVLFDCPDVPSAQFQFNLSSDVIALVAEDPTADIAPLFKSVNNLYLRNYQLGNFKKVVEYYSGALKARGWRALGQNSQDDAEKANLYIYILHENETISGIFVIVNSDDGIFLINIVCEIPRKQLGELLLNLNQLGIEIRELMSIKPHHLKLAPPPPLSDPAKPEPPITERRETTEPSSDETSKPQITDWYVDGKQINELQIQSALKTPEGTDPKQIEETIAAEKDNIMRILKNGSGELREIIPVLAGTLEDSRAVSLSVTEEGAKRIAIISLKSMRKISVLKSMKISGVNGKHVNISVDDRSVSQADEVETPLLAATRFWAKDAPIHEVRIQGNQKIPEARIRQTLENASKDIDKAVQTLFKAIPYFEEINLQVNEEEKRYIATITVTEKPLSTDAYLGFSPLMRFGFNRVTGWEIGTGFKVGKRKEVGPLWMWHIRETQSDQTSRLFGRVSYAFGNPHLHYRIGGIANWGRPYAWNIGMMAQAYRTTVAVAPELFPGYNNAWSIFARILGAPDLQNYYLQQGAAVSLRWSPRHIHPFIQFGSDYRSTREPTKKHRLVYYQLGV